MPTKLLTLLAVIAFTILVTGGSLILFQFYQPPEEGMGISLKDKKKTSPKSSSVAADQDPSAAKNQNQSSAQRRKPATQRRKPDNANPGSRNQQRQEAASGIIPAQTRSVDQVAGVDLNDLGDFTLGYNAEQTADTPPDQQPLDADQINAVSNINFIPSDEVYSRLLSSLDQLSRPDSRTSLLARDEEFILAVDDLIARHLSDNPALITPAASSATQTRTVVGQSAAQALRLALNRFNTLALESSAAAPDEDQLLAAVDQLVAARVGKALGKADAAETTAALPVETAAATVDSSLLAAVEDLFEVLETNPVQGTEPGQELVLDDKLLEKVDELVAARVGEALADDPESSREAAATAGASLASTDVNVALNDAVTKLLKLRDEAAKRRQDTAVASAEPPPDNARVDLSRVNKDALIKDLYDITLEFSEDP